LTVACWYFAEGGAVIVGGEGRSELLPLPIEKLISGLNLDLFSAAGADFQLGWLGE
jgi:hypothetical protein